MYNSPAETRAILFSVSPKALVLALYTNQSWLFQWLKIGLANAKWVLYAWFFLRTSIPQILIMPEPNQFPIIVFDFDGTIAKTDDLILQLYNKIAPKLSIKEVEAAEIDALKEMNTSKVMKHLKIYWFKVPRLWREMTAALSEHTETIELQAGMAQLLSDLAKSQVQFGVISSNSIENIEAVFEHNALPKPLFIGSSSALFKKHKVYKKLFKKHQLLLTNSIYVGDESRDIDVGRKLSVPVISVCWGFASKKSLRKAGATTICESLKELKDALDLFLKSYN